jgi:hypothetical protein
VVFKRLGIAVEPVLMNNAIALEKMRAGDIAAVVHVVGKPNDLFAKFKPEPGFHFLPVDYRQELSDYYVPATLDAADYPNLLAPGASIPTIAVPTVLAVFNWPADSDRFRRVSRFIEAYFAKFERLQQPSFQPKWQEVNLAGTVPGWTRYRVAEDVLAKMKAARVAPEQALRSRFESFLSTRADAGRALSSTEREALFNDFLKWQQR